MNKEVSFKESRIVGTSILLLFFGFGVSFIPDTNLVLLAFNLSLTVIAGLLFYLFWIKTRHESKRYYSLLSYVMLIWLGIYCAIPLLRIYFLTLTFWVGIIVLLIIVVLPHLYSRKIAYGIQKPGKSGLGKVFLIYTGLVIFLGVVVYRNTFNTSNPDALSIAVIMFIIGILFFFVSPALLIKPAEMDELMKE